MYEKNKASDVEFTMALGASGGGRKQRQNDLGEVRGPLWCLIIFAIII